MSYKLVELLESGELADLYRAVRQDGQKVVVKLFHPTTTDERYAAALARSTEQLSKVDDPRVIRSLEIGLWEDRLAVVRGDVGGVSFGQLLHRLASKDVAVVPTVAMALGLQLLEVLCLAEAQAVIHGALTPGNVYLGGQGQVAICDFGALEALLAAPALKKSFGASGRDTYRAPEVLQGDPPTTAADVYAAGAILYELLTLRPPYAQKTNAVSTRREALVPPSRLDRRIQTKLDALLVRALDMSPGRRFKSCADFQAGLRNYLASLGGLPSRGDLEKLVADVLTRQAPPAPDALPAAESFALRPVTGVRIRAMAAPPPPLSRAPFAEPSVEAAEPRPSNTTLPELPAAGAGKDEPTDPGQAGPLERGWEAPAGEAPAPRLSGARAELSQSGIRKSRVRMMASSPEPLARQDTLRDEPSRSLTPLTLEVPASEPALEPRPMAPPLSNISSEYVAHMVAGDEAAERARPPLRFGPFGIASAAVMVRRRQLLLLAAGVLGLGGILGIGVMVHAQRASPVETRELDDADVPDEPAPADASPGAPGFDVPPPRRQAGFLSIRSNVPVDVYVDGAKVRRRSPLKHYPVRPGLRMVEVENRATGQKWSSTVTVTRGHLEVVDVPPFGARR